MPRQSNPYELTTWGPQAVNYTDFTVPSGQMCQLRKLELTDLIGMGLLEQMDSLMAMFQEQVVEPVKGKKPQDRPKKKLTKAEQEAADASKEQEDFAKLIQSGKFEVLLRMVDQIAACCVVQPNILDCWATTGALDADGAPEYKRLEVDDRLADMVYVDALPIEDRFAIYGWAMEGFNLSDLAAFRDEPKATVDNVANVTDVSLPAKRSARAKS